MKKIFKRFLAYLIDLFIVSMISSCIMVIPFINVDRDNYNKNYKEYNELYTNYSKFSQDLTDYYKDDKSEKVNHPAHYNTGAFEVIDEMKLLFSKEEVKAFCKLNAYKYFRRAQFKGNPEQDNAKAEWYLKYLEEMEKD